MDKYTEFKNYMHNELGITKADIEQWTKEAIYEIAESYVKNRFSDINIENYVNKIANSASQKLEWTEIGWKDALERFVLENLQTNITKAIRESIKEVADTQ